MASQRRFFILAESIPASEVPSMMCRVVTDKLLPQQKFAPFPPVGAVDESQYRSTNTIIPDITPPPQTSLNSRDFVQLVKENELKLSLATFFGIDFGRGVEESLTLESAVVKRYSLPNPDIYFDKLMQDSNYAGDVRAMLESSHGRAYLVTGFLTATGTVWKRTSGGTKTTGFTAAVPVSAIAGLPVPGLDPAISPSVSASRVLEREKYVIEEEIFAVAYSEVRYSRSLDRTAPHFTKKLPVVGPPKRAKARHLALGEDSDAEVDVSSDEDEDEDGGDGVTGSTGATILVAEDSLVVDAEGPSVLL
jgi:hypothetical protein